MTGRRVRRRGLQTPPPHSGPAARVGGASPRPHDRSALTYEHSHAAAANQGRLDTVRGAPGSLVGTGAPHARGRRNSITVPAPSVASEPNRRRPRQPGPTRSGSVRGRRGPGGPAGEAEARDGEGGDGGQSGAGDRRRAALQFRAPARALLQQLLVHPGRVSRRLAVAGRDHPADRSDPGAGYVRHGSLDRERRAAPAPSWPPWRPPC